MPKVTIRALREKSRQVALKLSEVNDWINANVGTADIREKIRDRNLLSVELETLRRKLKYLQNHLPINGYSDGEQHLPVANLYGTRIRLS